MRTSNIAFYPCISIEDTDRFYREVIALETVYSDESSRIFSVNKGHFGFVQYEDRQAATGRFCLSINCGSEREVDQEYERLLSLGEAPMGSPAVHPNHPVYSFFIKDPNGYLVEFQKLKDMDI